MDYILLISLAIFIAVVAVLVWLRVNTNAKYEIKNSDIILGLLPVVLILFLSGKIKSFDFGDLHVEAAFEQASQKEINSQIDLLEGIPVSKLETETKGGVGKIPSLIENKTETLEFRLGQGNYYWPAIKQYFEALQSHSLLKYVIINNMDGTFFGMYEAGQLLNYLQAPSGEVRYKDFERFLNDSVEEKLQKLPGFIGAKQAIPNTSNRSRALTAMENFNLNFLPVINNANRLEGIVERSRLTASLILDVTKQLSGTSNNEE